MMPITPNSTKPDDDLPHPRSHSISMLQSSESPSHQAKADKNTYGLAGSGGAPNPTDMQLKYENDRLKLALAQRLALFSCLCLDLT